MKTFYLKSTRDISGSTLEYLENSLVSGKSRTPHSYLKTIEDKIDPEELRKLEDRNIIRKSSIGSGHEGEVLEVVHDKLVDIINESKKQRKKEKKIQEERIKHEKEREKRIQELKQIEEKREQERDRLEQENKRVKLKASQRTNRILSIALAILVILIGVIIYKGEKSSFYRQLSKDSKEEGNWFGRLNANDQEVVTDKLFPLYVLSTVLPSWVRRIRDDSIQYHKIKSSFIFSQNAINKFKEDPLVAFHLARKAIQVDENEISRSTIDKFPSMFALNEKNFQGRGAR